MSELVESDLPCPDCGSSDALAVYDDGHTFCFSCKKRRKGNPENMKTEKGVSTNNHSVEEFSEEDITKIEERGIRESVAKKFHVWSDPEPTNEIMLKLPYFDKEGNHVANKVRTRKSDRKYFWEGRIPSTLFGQHLFDKGGRTITLTEGEIDALSAYQMFGEKYPVVSVKSAATAKRDVKENFEYLNSFDEIVICFDNDPPRKMSNGKTHMPGQEAAIEVAEMFEIGKVRIVALREHKDANEYLMNGKVKEFQKAWWNGPKHNPTGLKTGDQMWEEIKAPREYDTVSYPFEGINEMTYGMRLGEFVVFTAKTGVGKTSIFKEIEHHILKNTPDDRGVGFMHFEETNQDTALGLMSISGDIPLHLPDMREKITDEQFRNFYDDVVNSERVVIWDHFGSNQINDVLAKVRHMHNMGCKYIFIDHLSIIVSDQSGDERKQLDEISTKLKTLCMELNIAIAAIVHQNRNGEIRGTAGIEQLANMVFQLDREQDHPDDWRRNVTKVTLKKNRFSGKAGPCSYLWYNPSNGRLVELDDDDVAMYEKGLSGNINNDSNEEDFPIYGEASAEQY